MSKHTPGPWSLRKPIIEFRGREKKPVWITTTDAGTLTREGRGDLSSDRVLADAMLIAAAPRMAKALQDAARILAELPDQSPQLTALRAEIVDTIKQATPEHYGYIDKGGRLWP